MGNADHIHLTCFLAILKFKEITNMFVLKITYRKQWIDSLYFD